MLDLCGRRKKVNYNFDLNRFSISFSAVLTAEELTLELRARNDELRKQLKVSFPLLKLYEKNSRNNLLQLEERKERLPCPTDVEKGANKPNKPPTFQSVFNRNLSSADNSFKIPLIAAELSVGSYLTPQKDTLPNIENDNDENNENQKKNSKLRPEISKSKSVKNHAFRTESTKNRRRALQNISEGLIEPSSLVLESKESQGAIRVQVSSSLLVLSYFSEC